MKIAVIGLGFMGATHLRALRGVAGLELAAVVSADERKLDGDLSGIQGNLGVAGGIMDFGGVARYRTLEECLRDPHVEALDICLPTDLHAEVAITALRAGKHVLVEKPMALDGESADGMREEAERAGRTLMCAQVVRFLSEYRVAAAEVKRLGAVRSAMFTRRCGPPAWSWWLGDAARSGGAVFDLLIHDVDYCVGLWGKPESVTARGFTDKDSGMDWMRAELRYEGMGPVAIEGGWYAPRSSPFRMEFTVVAERGTLEYGSAGRPLTLFREKGGSEAVPVAGNNGFADELAYFAECAGAGRRPEMCPPEDSAMAVRVMRLLLESRKRDGKRVLCSK